MVAEADIMVDYEQLRISKEAAYAKLVAIPGVHAVGTGAKIVGGAKTGDPSITVLVVKKKPLSDIAEDEKIPTEIDGFKTDVIEAEVPRAFGPADANKYRPVPGGAFIHAGGSPEAGTLGCLALTTDAVPKVVAITCQHVVAPPQGLKPTDLSITAPTGNASGASVSIGANNTVGTLIVARFGTVDSTGAPQIAGNAYYKTLSGDTSSSIATALVAAIIATKINGITTAAIGSSPEIVTVTFNPATGLKFLACTVFNAVLPTGANLIATTTGSVVTFSGSVDDDYAIYVSWNSDGNGITAGAFAPLTKGTSLAAVVTAVIQAVNAAGAGVTAAGSGTSGISLTNVAEVDCLITPNVRVGQPTDSFSSKCSLCCNDELGKVISADMSIDIALIQLVAGIQYLNEQKWIPLNGPASTPNQLVKGSYVVTPAQIQAGYPVQKYGATTQLTNGTIQVNNLSGRYTTNSGTSGAYTWEVFYRYYQNALLVTSPLGSPFSAGGDSGSAVLNSSGQVVGILFAGGSTQSLVTPIQSVMSTMKVTIPTASTLGQALTVTDAQGVLAMSMIPQGIVTETLTQVKTELSITTEGKIFADVVQRHAPEVQTLANTNKRVATVWRRNGGPEMLQTVFNMARSKDQRFPSEVNGKPLTECLLKLQKILTRYGSEPLVDDLAKYSSRLLALSHLSYPQMLSILSLQGEQ
jgi:hypothetical protein